MIREYLGRVSVAATKVLPKGDRLLFVGRTRAAIEAQVGPLASADADDVRNALTTLGEPEELAKRERERLYSARRRGAAAAPPALWKPSKESRRRAVPPPPPARLRPNQARRTWPWPRGGLAGPDGPQPGEAATPATTPEPAPAVPRQAESPEATAAPAETPAAGTPPSETPAAESATGEESGAGPATGEEPTAGVPAAGVPAAGAPAAGISGADVPTADVPTADVPAAEEPAADAPAPEGPTADVPGTDLADPGLNGREPGGTPPGWLRPVHPVPPPGETKPLSIVPGMTQSEDTEEPPLSRRSPPVAAPLGKAWALARKHPLEAVSTVLLGVGGLIFPFPIPFPFWLIGGIIALKSWRWDARDKWMALAGPLLVTFAVLLIRAVTSQGNFFSAFYHAAGNDGVPSIRAGCVLCAGYLIWRLRRGPRLRTLPPWQRPR